MRIQCVLGLLAYFAATPLLCTADAVGGHALHVEAEQYQIPSLLPSETDTSEGSRIKRQAYHRQHNQQYAKFKLNFFEFVALSHTETHSCIKPVKCSRTHKLTFLISFVQALPHSIQPTVQPATAAESVSPLGRRARCLRWEFLQRELRERCCIPVWNRIRICLWRTGRS